MNYWIPVKFLFLACLTTFSLISCSGSGSGSSGGNSIHVAKISGFNPNHGPFDSKGNYREEWANNPPKRIFVSEGKLASIQKDEPDIPATASYTAPIPRPAYPTSTYSKPTTSTYTKPTSTYKKPTTTSSYKKPTSTYKKPTTTTKKTTSSYKKPSTTYKKPTPKPVVTKVVPKQKPPILHKVVKGDTLYSLSQKYKSGVKTIQIANHLKGNTINIGQTLKIPRF